MSTVNLDEIREALAKATPGPIANAPTWLAEMVEELERLRELRDHMLEARRLADRLLVDDTHADAPAYRAAIIKANALLDSLARPLPASPKAGEEKKCEPRSRRRYTGRKTPVADQTRGRRYERRVRNSRS